MRERLQRLVGPRGASRSAAVAAAAVLVTAVWSAYHSIERMDAGRDEYGPLTAGEREREIEDALGFEHAVWDGIRRAVRDDDRFAVVSDAPEQHEVRNYAAYSLLPAIQVVQAEEATVVVYWKTEPPAGTSCIPVADDVCLERRGRA